MAIDVGYLATPQMVLSQKVSYGTWVLTLLSWMLDRLPLWGVLLLGRLVGWLWHTFIPIRRRVARCNIAQALPEIALQERHRIIRKCFTHQATSAIEILRAAHLNRNKARDWVVTKGVHHLHTALSNQKGAILVIAHVGNIDLAGMSQAMLGLPLCVIAKELHAPWAQRFVTHLRQRAGVEVIAPRQSATDIRHALGRNRIVVFAVDQHVAKHRAIVCSFFGRSAATTPAPSRFALETEAPVFTGVTWRQTDGRHAMRIDPIIEMEQPHNDRHANIRHNTERLNHIVERYIRQYPQQWLWLHRRWKI